MKSHNEHAVPSADESLEGRVLAIVADLLAVERSSVDINGSIEELVADSLDQVRLFMALEDEFGGAISDDRLSTIETLADVVNFLRQRAM
ncbi:MAG: acyl carrier protein [Gammaproteobacteria bacterium]|nr:acyl carrier protein [Gammaproteobacteria bacterium]